MNLTKIFDLNFNYKRNGNFFFVNDRYRFEKNLRSLIFSRVLNKYYNMGPIIITDKTNYNNNNLYKKSKIKYVSLREKISIKKIILYSNVLLSILNFYFKISLKKKKIEWLINNYKIRQVKIGDLIYDYYVRYNNNYIKPNVYSITFLKVLFDGIFKIIFISYYFKKYKPKLILSTSKGYTSIGNLIVRIGTKQNIKTISTGYNYIYKYRSYQDSFKSIWKISKKQIDNLEKKISINKINNFSNKRILGKKYGNYVSHKTLDKAFKTQNDLKFIYKILKEKKNKKIIVFALHCFSDAPHTSGNLIFNDYYDQFTSTIQYIAKNNDENFFWIIKPHPARNNYNEKGIIENYLRKFKFKNVVMCTKNIKNNILIKYTDFLITSNSTIGLEFACSGKKTILGGDSPYYFKNLFIKPKNKKEYFDIIKNLNKKNIFLSKKDTNFAKKILYYLEHATNITLPGSKFMPNPIINPLIDNEKNYKKQIIVNCKNNLKVLDNKHFVKEKFYIELKKILKSLANG